MLCTEKEKDDCRFLTKTLQARCQWNNIFKVPKEGKKNGQSRILYPARGKSKDISRNTEAKKILHQQTHTGTNVKRGLPRRWKMTPDGDLNVHKGIRALGTATPNI